MSDFVVKDGLVANGSIKGNTGTVTGNATLDLSTGDAFEVTPTADVTFAFSNPPAAGNAQAFSVALTGAEVGASYDLANASYDGVSFSVAGQETGPQSISLSSNGTKMFVVGRIQDTVYQYSLSTAFDLSTASYDSVSFSVAAQATFPSGLAFKPDGTKMYIMDKDTATAYQYSLSTAFDLSTASYDSVSFSVEAQQNQPTDFVFSSDGAKMFMIADFFNDSIYQYNLSTAFDLSTASYSGTSFSVTSQENAVEGVVFNSQGTKMFVIGNGSDSVHQYSLSTAFDLSTASYDSVSFSVAAQDGNPRALAFSSTGGKLYVIGEASLSVFQYTTGTSDIATFTYPASVQWSGGTAPTTPADGVTDLLTFYTEDGGNTYYGFKVGEAMA